jgi:hypothetical protein
MTEFHIPCLSNYEWQKSVISKSISTPPISPNKGDRYIVGTSPVGYWTGQEGNISFFDGLIWRFIDKFGGMVVFVENEQQFYFYAGSSWKIYLLVPRIYSAIGNTNITTTSASFVDIPNMILSGTPIPGNCFISFNTVFSGASREVRIVLDGAPVVTSYGSGTSNISLLWSQYLSELNHEIKCQWRRTSTGTVTQSGGTYIRSLHIIVGLDGTMVSLGMI